MDDKTREIALSVDTSLYLSKPLPEWRPILSQECQVYVCGEQYIAKRFDQINYVFCSKDTAKEILVDNLYAILRYKYFPKQKEEVDKRIDEIVKSFTTNLKTSLKKISFLVEDDGEKVCKLPCNCMAFRNGVYDFKNDQWLFKYKVIDIPSLNNKIYLYDPKYIILWYININFEPFPFSVMDVSIQDFVDVMKDQGNYCFKLVYNMSHDEFHQYNYGRFTHLCEVLGYTLLQDFCQSFVMFIGTGGNGKNSLFDGCITPYIIPSVASNDLNAVENDRFITGALENHYQNIYLESDAKTYDKSTVLKNITGSPNQTIEPKGINKYQGYLNVKFIYSANDQDKIKFGDTTEGFRRRANMFEIYYKWDSKKKFLNKGDYYDTTFSEDLREIKRDLSNVIEFIYLAMLGIKHGTKDFEETFKFSSNDWKEKYNDVDLELKDKIENIRLNHILDYMKQRVNYEEAKLTFFDVKEKRLYQSQSLNELGYKSFEDMIKMLEDDEMRISFFSNNDVYINVRVLYKLTGDLRSSTYFTQSLKKIYQIRDIPFTYNNKPYIKCNFISNRIKVLGE